MTYKFTSLHVICLWLQVVRCLLCSKVNIPFHSSIFWVWFLCCLMTRWTPCQTIGAAEMLFSLMLQLQETLEGSSSLRMNNCSLKTWDSNQDESGQMFYPQLLLPQPQWWISHLTSFFYIFYLFIYFKSITDQWSVTQQMMRPKHTTLRWGNISNTTNFIVITAAAALSLLKPQLLQLCTKLCSNKRYF